MKTITIAELRKRFGFHLGKVKAGQEILLCERNVPIARMVPISRENDDDSELAALAAKGKIKLGAGAIDASFWELPGPCVPMNVLKRAVEQERDEE